MTGALLLSGYWARTRGIDESKRDEGGDHGADEWTFHDGPPFDVLNVQ